MMRVLGFGTYDVRLHPRVGVLLQGLRDLGVTVVEANEPLGVSTADKVAMLAKPWRALSLVPLLLGKWFRIARRAKKAAKSQSFDAILVGYMGHFDVILARMLFWRGQVVLDQMIFAADTAIDRGSRGVKVSLLRLLDRIATGCASVVVVDTEEQISLLAPSQRRKALVVPVGSPQAWFIPLVDQSSSGHNLPLRVVFYGLFTPLQGALTIARSIAKLAGDTRIWFTMVGGGQDYEMARQIAAPNTRVNWIDWVPSDQLPALVADHDVCLGIFGTTGKGARVVPNKVFQGAAAGRAIVTSDTEPQRRLFGDAALYVSAGDAEELARSLTQLSSDRESVLELQQSASMLARHSFRPSEIAKPLHSMISVSSRRESFHPRDALGLVASPLPLPGIEVGYLDSATHLVWVGTCKPKLAKRSAVTSDYEETSERVHPDSYQDDPASFLIYTFHIATYEFARKFAAGKIVLDYGCGTGYGVARLAADCSAVTGIDVSPAAISFAENRYQHENLKYQVVDPVEVSPLPFADSSFDVVTSFQVIEHVPDTAAYLAEAFRVLKPGGHLLMATPDRTERLFTRQRPWNQFHLVEYSTEEIIEMLVPFTREVSSFGMGGSPAVFGIEFSRAKKLKWITFPFTFPGAPERWRQFGLSTLKKLKGRTKTVPTLGSGEGEAPYSFDVVRIEPGVTPSVNIVVVATKV